LATNTNKHSAQNSPSTKPQPKTKSPGAERKEIQEEDAGRIRKEIDSNSLRKKKKSKKTRKKQRKAP